MRGDNYKHTNKLCRGVGAGEMGGNKANGNLVAYFGKKFIERKGQIASSVMPL